MVPRGFFGTLLPEEKKRKRRKETQICEGKTSHNEGDIKS